MGLAIPLAGVFFFFLLYGMLPTPALLAGALLLCGGFLLLQTKFRHHQGGFLSIDAMAQRSRLGELHPGLKLAFSVACALLCVAADTLAVSVFVVASMLLLTVGVGKTPLHAYTALLAVPVIFIVLGTVAVLLELSPTPLGLLDIPVGNWYICVTRAGQEKSLALTARAFGAVSCLYFLSLSTPMHQIIGCLRRAKFPGVVVELMYLIYRYIFVLLEVQNQMHTAAQARLGYRTWRTSLKTMFHSSLYLLFLSFRRSSDCFAAMEARCYDGTIAFWEQRRPLRTWELAAAGGYLLLLLACWYVSRRVWQ